MEPNTRSPLFWLLALSVIIVRFVHDINSPCLFISEWYSVVRICHHLFIHSLVCGYLGCVQFTALICRFPYKSLYGHISSFLLSKYRVVKWMGCLASVCSSLSQRGWLMLLSPGNGAPFPCLWERPPWFKRRLSRGDCAHPWECRDDFLQPHVWRENTQIHTWSLAWQSTAAIVQKCGKYRKVQRRRLRPSTIRPDFPPRGEGSWQPAAFSSSRVSVHIIHRSVWPCVCSTLHVFHSRTPHQVTIPCSVSRSEPVSGFQTHWMRRSWGPQDPERPGQVTTCWGKENTWTFEELLAQDRVETQSIITASTLSRGHMRGRK